MDPAEVKSEEMNNFYFRMPGGANRYHDGKGFLDVVHDECRPYLSQPEDAWPPDKAGLIKEHIKQLCIEKAIDEYLAQHPRIAGWWEDWYEAYPHDLKAVMREIVQDQILRPVYVAMRAKFGREELTV